MNRKKFAVNQTFSEVRTKPESDICSSLIVTTEVLCPPFLVTGKQSSMHAAAPFQVYGMTGNRLCPSVPETLNEESAHVEPPPYRGCAVRRYRGTWDLHSQDLVGLSCG